MTRKTKRSARPRPRAAARATRPTDETSDAAKSTRTVLDVFRRYADAEGLIDSICERRLAKPHDKDTWLLWMNSLDALGGVTFAAAITDAMCSMRRRDRGKISKLEHELANPAVATALRRLLARHAASVYEAWQLSDEDPDDWRTMDLVLGHSLGSDEWSIQMKLVKYNGEHVGLQGSTRSLGHLTRRLMQVVAEAAEKQALPRKEAVRCSLEAARFAKAMGRVKHDKSDND